MTAMTADSGDDEKSVDEACGIVVEVGEGVGLRRTGGGVGKCKEGNELEWEPRGSGFGIHGGG